MPASAAAGGTYTGQSGRRDTEPDIHAFKIAKVADATVGGQRVRRLRMGLDRWCGFALPEVRVQKLAPAAPHTVG